ncbi:MAG: vWA domain-containing protein [Persicimonas sp.]
MKAVFAGSLAVATMLAITGDARADDVVEYDGSWKAPDVSIFMGSDVLVNAGTDKTGTSLNETISNHWVEGDCVYDEDTGEPSDTCDRLRYGLTMYRGPADSDGVCVDLLVNPFWPKEDGGGHLTDDDEKWKIDGEQYKIASLGGKTHLYCSDHPDQRPLGEVMYSYRDQRLAELGTNWPDRPQLHYHVIKNLPQQSDGANGKQVRESLEAACSLYHGNGNQHLSMPSWIMTSPNSTADADLYGGMLAAAGGTGQCCYKDTLDVDCDPTDPADVIDMCDHLGEQTIDGDMRHNESRLREDITDGRYKCSRTEKVAGTGAMEAESQSEMKCHLQGSNCDDGDYPTNLWPLMSCVQFRPSNIHPDDLAIHYCGDDVESLLSEEDKDTYDYRDDDEECITLSVANGGLEYVDEEQHLFYPTLGGTDICVQIAHGLGWTQIVCPNQGKLCDLNDGSQCSLGRFECINERDVCERYPGNDSCDSAACGKESIHETGIVHPNVQFAVDRSGSMGGSRWSEAKTVAQNLADWSYQGSGCEDDGTNCDKLRLGVHFWNSNSFAVHPAMEDMTSAIMGDAFDDYGPTGGTQFHQAAKLLAGETALEDPDNPSNAIFITDGKPDHAFTTREGVRRFCDLKNRASSPVATYSVGYQGGNEPLNSLIAAAGGTGQCCFSGDGDCDDENEVSPCEMYQYELDNGQSIVDDFVAWLDSNGYRAQWDEIVQAHEDSGYTSDSFNAGTVATHLDMVDDSARFLYANLVGDPELIDCNVDSGDPNGDEEAFLRHTLCRTEQTLAYVVRHKYNSEDKVAEEHSLDDYWKLKDIRDDSPFLAHQYVCNGSKFANDSQALYEELQAILEAMECTYPLSLLDDQESAPEFTDATHVKLYMPEYDAVVRIPYAEDDDGLQEFEDEMCALGVPNCTSYGDDGWSFANEGRTAVELSAELCDYTKSDDVEKVTTQVCRTCDPDQLGDACDWVKCNPTSFPDGSDGYGYDDEGVQCQEVDHPCPDNPNETCTSWAKTGRCGMGEYACDDRGLPYCEQVHSRMPEICNGVDDDCDGDIDDLAENREEWDDDKYDITGEDYDGWYCSYHDSCRCPDGQPDSIGGDKTDDDEFVSMMEHQQEYGNCECGEGLSADFEPTRTYSVDDSSQPDEPKAGCSAAGSGSAGGFASTVLALLFGVFGLRRRRG